MRSLVIYPYVYIKVIGNETLLFNLVNNEYIINHDYSVSVLFSTLLQNVTISNVINCHDLSDSFINDIVDKKMARLDVSNSAKEILQFPSLNLKEKEISFAKSENFIERLKNLDHSPITIDHTVRDNINIITIHYSTINLDSIYSQAYKQYPFPQLGTPISHIDLDVLYSFLGSYKKIKRLNLVIGQVYDININPLLCFLNEIRRSIDCQIYFYCIEAADIDICKFEKLVDKIYVWRIGNNHKYNNNLLHLVMDYSDIEKLLMNEICCPCYNLNNYEFLKDILSYSINELFSLRHSEKGILCKRYLNENTFGELTILSDGSIFSDISKESIGNVKYNSLNDIVLKELSLIRNWFITRSNLDVCKNCIYNELCPSVSKIELCMHKYCFCNKKL